MQRVKLQESEAKKQHALHEVSINAKVIAQQKVKMHEGNLHISLKSNMKNWPDPPECIRELFRSFQNYAYADQIPYQKKR